MAEIRKLRERLLPKLAKEEGMHGDGGGLFLRVRDGRASWVLRLSASGIRQEIGLGGFPTVPLSVARELAATARAKIKAGQPVRVKRQPKKVAPLFKDIYIEAIDNQAAVRGWTSAHTRATWERGAEIWMLPALGDKRVDAITRDDILGVLRRVRAETSGAYLHIIRSKLAVILSYCKSRRFIRDNPAEWRGNLDQFLPSLSVAHATAHCAAPAFEQLRDEIIPALAARGDSGGRLVLFGILTALRANESAGALWSEIDLGGAVFEVPWERIKTAKHSREGFRVPLSRQAVALLSAMQPGAGPVFVSSRGDRFDRRACWNLMHKWGVTFHGIRSTFRDWCAREDIPFHVAEKCLNHSVGGQVVRAYFRDDLLEQRRGVMQRWADAVMPRGS